MKVILLTLLVCALGVEAIKTPELFLQERLAETKSKLLTAESPNDIMDATTHLYVTLGKMFNYASDILPIDKMKETVRYFEDNVEVLVRFTGERVFNVLDQ